MTTALRLRAPRPGPSIATATAMAMASLVGPAHATEGGGSVYRNGAEAFLGCCALPPPGVYEVLYLQHYRADELRGNNGQVVSPPGFEATATAIIPRVMWVTPYTFAGGRLAAHALLPLVDLDINVMPGLQQRRKGAGDLTVGAALGWQLAPTLHGLVALDVYAPTGRWDRNDLANIGRNQWALQPLAALTLTQPQGPNADVKAMWTVNRRNPDTDYRSGQELTVDYAVGWGLGNGWKVGAAGYAYQQITNDRQAGATVPDNKGRAFAIGPEIQYQHPIGLQVNARFERESSVRNRAAGDSFWVKAIFKF